MVPALEDIVPLVKAVVREELMPRFRHAERRYKPDGSIVTEADLAAQARLGRLLAERHPAIPLLGEEMAPAAQRAFLDRHPDLYWCLDPVDGTSNFAAGLPFFSLSLALMRGHEAQFGVVYDPNTDECYSAVRGQGAWLNGRRLDCPSAALPLRRCLAMVDFKRLGKPLAMALVARPPFSSLRYTGSGSLEWCWLAAGRFHVYLHGEQKLWDYAAGALILAEAGGIAATLAGEPVYAPGALSRSIVAAVAAPLFEDWRQAIAERLAA
ncbi:inositol monophosphatase family protein [Methyloparacoccus murrellii]